MKKKPFNYWVIASFIYLLFISDPHLSNTGTWIVSNQREEPNMNPVCDCSTKILMWLMMRTALDAASQQLFLRMQQEETLTASLLNYI